MDYRLSLVWHFSFLFFLKNIMNTIHPIAKKTPLSFHEIQELLKQFDQIISYLQNKIQEEKDPDQVKTEFESLVFGTLIPMIRKLDNNAYNVYQDEYIGLKKQIQEITSERFLSKGTIVINNKLNSSIMKILSQITGKTYKFSEENLTLGQKDYLRELGFLRERYIQALWVSKEQLKEYDKWKLTYSDELLSWLSPSSLDTER